MLYKIKRLTGSFRRVAVSAALFIIIAFLTIVCSPANAAEIESDAVFAEGYDFSSDSYWFANYGDEIDLEYFTTLYETGTGKVLYDLGLGEDLSGLCYGLAQTTAAILNGLPDVEDISLYSLLELQDACETLRDVGKTSRFEIADGSISISDYIRYAFLYQMGSENTDAWNENINDINALYSAVKAAIDSGESGVTISFMHYYTNLLGESTLTGAHQVLAVGYSDHCIYVDDSNNRGSLEVITIDGDTWSYSGEIGGYAVSSANSDIYYQNTYAEIYETLASGTETVSVDGNSYVLGASRIEAENLVCFISEGGDWSSTTPDWIMDLTYVGIENFYEENNTVWVGGDEAVFKLSFDECRIMYVTIDGSRQAVTMSLETGDPVTLRNENVILSDDGTVTTVALEVSGSVSGDVSMTKTSSGFSVSGVDSGTVTLYIDDNEASSLSYQGSELEITYDDSGAGTDLRAASENGTYTSDSFLGFTDITSADIWYYSGVEYCCNTGLMIGTGSNTFSPDLPMTRAMLAAILYRLEGTPSVSGGSSFSDVETDAWYEDAVIWAEQIGIVEGYTDGTFGITDNVTRAELTAILYRYAEYKNYYVETDAEPEEILNPFSDSYIVDDWALRPMAWAVDRSLINGIEVNSNNSAEICLEPDSYATRAQVATILCRFVQNAMGIVM